MDQHTHIGIISLLTTFLMIIPPLFFIRWFMLKYPDSQITQALAFFFG